MAKRGENAGGRDLVKIEAPAHLQQYMQDDTSLAEMQKHRVVPRLKVIQGTSADDLQAMGVGSIVLSPGNVMVAEINAKERKTEPFRFVPVLFFVEYLKIRDLKDKQGSMLMERTYDQGSELARKATNQKTRKEVYGDKGEFTLRNAEVFNFPGFIYSPDHKLKGELVTLAFKTGEYTVGQNFITALTMRKLPLWSQVFALQTKFRTKGENKWWGIDWAPADPNTITAEEVEFFRDAHTELKKLQEKKMLVVDHSDGGADEETEAQAAAAASEEM